jgi:hypothetical protein
VKPKRQEYGYFPTKQLSKSKKRRCKPVLSAVGLASDTDRGINLHVYATATSLTSPGNCHRAAISSNYEDIKVEYTYSNGGDREKFPRLRNMNMTVQANSFMEYTEPPASSVMRSYLFFCYVPAELQTAINTIV